MKIFFYIFALIGLWITVNGLPQLVGIVDQEILEVLDSIYSEKFSEFSESESKADPTTTCDYGSFSQAFLQWTIDSKFNQSMNYTNNGEALKSAVNGIFDGFDLTDPDGAGQAWDTFCVAQRKFFNLQGVFQISNCILATILVQNGYNRVDAYQTQQVLTQLNYQCGAAFNTYVNTITTYVNVSGQSTVALNTCSNDFINNLNSTGLADHGCSALSIYENCIGKVYYTATNNIDLGWTVCEATRRSNSITLPNCRDSATFCQVSQLTG